MKLLLLKEEMTVCKVRSCADIDYSAPLVFVGKTSEEISLVCPRDAVPAETLAREDGWRCFRVCGTLEFSLIGILSGISAVLAENGIGIFVVSTYDTDFILVKSQNAERAARALEAAGYEIA